MSARDCADGGDQSERINTPRDEVPDLLADSADEEEAPPKQRAKLPSLPRRGKPGSRGSWNAEGTTSSAIRRSEARTPPGTSPTAPPTTSGRDDDLAIILSAAGRAVPWQTDQTGIKVDNVPAGLSMDDLHDTFGDVGSVKHLERQGRSVRVWFASEAEAARATTTFHGGELNGAKITAVSLEQDQSGEVCPTIPP